MLLRLILLRLELGNSMVCEPETCGWVPVGLGLNRKFRWFMIREDTFKAYYYKNFYTQ
jgi:hypothetical protein